MLVIGLTGGIATGKSTVSRLLSTPSSSSSRITLLDADVLARDVIAPGTSGYDAVIQAFGTEQDVELWRAKRVERTRLGGATANAANGNVNDDEGWPAGSRLLRPDGTMLDRAYIASLVFVKDGSDPAAKQRLRTLNGIVHPRVRRALLFGVIKAWWKGQAACVLDVPLLIEAGLDRWCGEVVVVYVNPETQLERLLKRPDPNSSSSTPTLTLDQARSRIAAQLPLDQKLQRADVILDNSGDLSALEPQVARLVERWVSKDEQLWTRIWRKAGRWFPPLAMMSAVWTLVARWASRRSDLGGARTQDQPQQRQQQQERRDQ